MPDLRSLVVSFPRTQRDISAFGADERVGQPIAGCAVVVRDPCFQTELLQRRGHNVAAGEDGRQFRGQVLVDVDGKPRRYLVGSSLGIGHPQLVALALAGGDGRGQHVRTIAVHGEPQSDPLPGNKPRRRHGFVERECQRDLGTFDHTDLARVFDRLLGQVRVGRIDDPRIGPDELGALIDADGVVACAPACILNVVEQIGLDTGNDATEHGVL